jgi:PAS domain S-box-containing protein
VSVVRDITERKQAVEELMAQRHTYEQIIEQSLAGYWDWDLPTGYEYLSPTFKKMFGYEDNEIENSAESWQKLIFSEDLPIVIEKFNQHIESKGKIPFYTEVRYHHKDGSIVWVICTGKVIEWDDNEKAIRMIGCHIDITTRKNIEQELIKAKERAQESDLLKSAFLANMSHEIRTPMNGILGFAGLLKEPNLSGEQQQKYIRIIEKSGARMLNIINDIVDISKIESGQMRLDIKESNINEQVEYIYTFFKPEVEAKGMKISFKTGLPAKEAIIKTDREKVYSILTNLVKNAIKYSKEGTIEFGYDVAGKIHEFCLLKYYVKDTGIGIPKERQEAIFERFVQADIIDVQARQGAGLGLAISKAYIEMLGGKIWVESEVGGGSAFYFTLPYNPEPTKVEPVQQHSPSEIVDHVRKLKILIVEDDDVSEVLMAISINEFGTEILNARTGVEAIEVCKRNPDIDLVLMDIRMPQMGGYEATRLIREFNKEVVIIAQTAYGLAGDKEKAIEAGCNDYISKPINKDELQTLMLKYFGN